LTASISCFESIKGSNTTVPWPSLDIHVHCKCPRIKLI
jgi:hypothetical protein